MQIMRSKKDIDLLIFCVGKYTRESDYFFQKYGKFFQNGGRRLQNSHNIQYLICHRWLTQYTLFPTKGGWLVFG